MIPSYRSKSDCVEVDIWVGTTWEKRRLVAGVGLKSPAPLCAAHCGTSVDVIGLTTHPPQGGPGVKHPILRGWQEDEGSGDGGPAAWAGRWASGSPTCNGPASHAEKGSAHGVGNWPWEIREGGLGQTGP